MLGDLFCGRLRDSIMDIEQAACLYSPLCLSVECLNAPDSRDIDVGHSQLVFEGVQSSPCPICDRFNSYDTPISLSLPSSSGSRLIATAH